MGRRKGFSNTWWADKWIGVLESFGWANRLQRGRNYARHGHVLDIDISPGTIEAKVQGTSSRPYRVTIHIKPLSQEEWQNVIETMASHAIFVARLLADEMPQDIEVIFTEAGVSLFPDSSGDISTTCSCPDWANPCKHIAAVHYILAQEFDQNPFLIFKIRGMDPDILVETLRQKRSTTSKDEDFHMEDETPEHEIQPLNMESFWKCGSQLDSFTVDISPPKVSGSILKRLGPPPFDPEDQELTARLKKAYKVISKRALDRAYGSP